MYIMDSSLGPPKACKCLTYNLLFPVLMRLNGHVMSFLKFNTSPLVMVDSKQPKTLYKCEPTPLALESRFMLQLKGSC